MKPKVRVVNKVTILVNQTMQLFAKACPGKKAKETKVTRLCCLENCYQFFIDKELYSCYVVYVPKRQFTIQTSEYTGMSLSLVKSLDIFTPI